MTAEQVPSEVRKSDLFNHIDMGFLNRRLAMSALGSLREEFIERKKPGNDHMTVLVNDHLLVTMLIDICNHFDVPTLMGAINKNIDQCMFMSVERLQPCPDIYEKDRVSHDVYFDIDVNKPVKLTYHTEHLVSSTGKMCLSDGYQDGYVESIIGRLRDRGDFWEIEPIVMGAPILDHPRNHDSSSSLMWYSRDYGELLAEDIEQFSRLKKVNVQSADEWMETMKSVPEAQVKEAFADLLNEPTKKDWGGEENDHFSSNAMVAGKRHTAAFLLKGPANFQEMKPAMCGKNGDQIYRLANSGADISVVQHAHLIGSAVRATLRSFIVTAGKPRKYCVIDGQITYRILKAYGYI